MFRNEDSIIRHEKSIDSQMTEDSTITSSTLFSVEDYNENSDCPLPKSFGTYEQQLSQTSHGSREEQDGAPFYKGDPNNLTPDDRFMNDQDACDKKIDCESKIIGNSVRNKIKAHHTPYQQQQYYEQYRNQHINEIQANNTENNLQDETTNTASEVFNDLYFNQGNTVEDMILASCVICMCIYPEEGGGLFCPEEDHFYCNACLERVVDMAKIAISINFARIPCVIEGCHSEWEISEIKGILNMVNPQTVFDYYEAIVHEYRTLVSKKKEDNIETVLNYIKEEVLTFRCRNCHAPFTLENLDEQDCSAMICSKCNYSFCELCLDTFPDSDDAHGHLTDVHGALYVREEAEKVHLKRRQMKLVSYLISLDKAHAEIDMYLEKAKPFLEAFGINIDSISVEVRRKGLESIIDPWSRNMDEERHQIVQKYNLGNNQQQLLQKLYRLNEGTHDKFIEVLKTELERAILGNDEINKKFDTEVKRNQQDHSINERTNCVEENKKEDTNMPTVSRNQDSPRQNFKSLNNLSIEIPIYRSSVEEDGKQNQNQSDNIFDIIKIKNTPSRMNFEFLLKIMENNGNANLVEEIRKYVREFFGEPPRRMHNKRRGGIFHSTMPITPGGSFLLQKNNSSNRLELISPLRELGIEKEGRTPTNKYKGTNPQDNDRETESEVVMNDSDSAFDVASLASNRFDSISSIRRKSSAKLMLFPSCPPTFDHYYSGSTSMYNPQTSPRGHSFNNLQVLGLSVHWRQTNKIRLETLQNNLLSELHFSAPHLLEEFDDILNKWCMDIEPLVPSNKTNFKFLADHLPPTLVQSIEKVVPSFFNSESETDSRLRQQDFNDPDSTMEYFGYNNTFNDKKEETDSKTIKDISNSYNQESSSSHFDYPSRNSVQAGGLSFGSNLGFLGDETSGSTKNNEVLKLRSPKFRLSFKSSNGLNLFEEQYYNHQDNVYGRSSSPSNQGNMPNSYVRYNNLSQSNLSVADLVSQSFNQSHCGSYTLKPSLEHLFGNQEDTNEDEHHDKDQVHLDCNLDQGSIKSILKPDKSNNERRRSSISSDDRKILINNKTGNSHKKSMNNIFSYQSSFLVNQPVAQMQLPPSPRANYLSNDISDLSGIIIIKSNALSRLLQKRMPIRVENIEEIQGNFTESTSVFVAYKRPVKYSTSNLNLNALYQQEPISNTSKKGIDENANFTTVLCAIATICIDNEKLQDIVSTNDGKFNFTFDEHIMNQNSEMNGNERLKKDAIVADNIMPLASQSTLASVYTYSNPVAR